ncbi:MAG: hypothetical protein GW859_01115 [Sphingomonadales bacterium]|nr:hypothetical protein [Sphingomonadales bacterium]
MPINRQIEQFLRQTGMPPTVFGRRVMRDPRFVFDLRNGREPGRKVRSRVEHFMNIWRREGCPRYVARPPGRPA